jgi:Protein of unknown function (DUF1549)/Protein of unknown function (DUF1553)/Planctomycete cytochrome C
MCRAAVATLLAFAFASPARADDKTAFFEAKIRPVLVESCYSCHSSTAKKRGGLLLDSKDGLHKGGDSGAAIKPGSPNDSLLVKALRYGDPDLKMPPKGKLPANVIADFERWIADGAVDPRDAKETKTAGIDFDKARHFWSFEKPTMPKAPDVKNAAWTKTPIDRFILAKIEAEGLQPAEMAEPRTLIRRLTFDLTGLPPTPEEVDAFLADKSPDAYAKLVDRLLASPHYGERWGRYWLDVARYAEDQAHTFAVKPNTQAFLYRDWVIAAFNEDMPYDRFVKMQIAADVIDMPEAERIKQLPALGFFGLGAQYYKNTDAAKAAADELDDRVDTLSRAFLGLTVSCARCHDHKFDPIPQMDYYSLAGIFSSSKLADVQLAPKDVVAKYQEGQSKLKKIDDGQKAFLKAEKTAFAERSVGDTAKYMVAAWKTQSAKISAKEAAKRDKLSVEGVDRWVKFLQKTPKGAVFDSCRAMFVQPASAGEAAVEAKAKEFESQVKAALEARAAKKMAKGQDELLNGFFGEKGPFLPSDDEVKRHLPDAGKAKLTEFAKETDAVKKAYPMSAPPAAHGLAEATPADMKVFLRGNPAKLGDVAPRRFLHVLAGDSPKPFTHGSGRLDLADAVASADNPLTARVFVNRIWQRHFGRGLVGTASNFGQLGERPTHPELLDYLASRFVEQKWSVKAIHREILMSAVYRASSAPIPANMAKDADNRWLWKHGRSRLDIEAWRDSMLAVSGQLDPKMGGPTFNLGDTNVKRRTVYAKISRHDLNATLRMFDFPDANITSEKRTETTVPQQQLFVLNSPFVVESAKALAARVQKDAKADPERVARLFALAVGRPATTEESAVALDFLKETDPAADQANVKLTRWERLSQAVLAGNEFMYVD